METELGMNGPDISTICVLPNVQTFAKGLELGVLGGRAAHSPTLSSRPMRERIVRVFLIMALKRRPTLRTPILRRAKIVAAFQAQAELLAFAAAVDGKIEYHKERAES